MALRKAKIVCKFGLSECDRINWALVIFLHCQSLLTCEIYVQSWGSKNSTHCVSEMAKISTFSFN